MNPAPTPRTDAVAKNIGKLAALWKDGTIHAAEFCEKTNAALDEARTLERELAAAKEDAERIDWLADQNRREREAMSEDKQPEAGVTLIVFREHGEFEFVDGDTFRDAIDQARMAGT